MCTQSHSKAEQHEEQLNGEASRSSIQRAQGPPCPLVLQLAAVTEERDTGVGHGMSQIVAGKGQKLYLQACVVSEYTGFLPSRGTDRSGIRCTRSGELVLGLCPLPFPTSAAGKRFLTGLWAPLLRVKALCVIVESAPRWLMGNKVAFSGAAKLRLLRGQVEVGAPKRPAGEEASGRNHAFASLAVSHGSPIVVGSCCFVGFLLPAFLCCLPALSMAPGAACHCC